MTKKMTSLKSLLAVGAALAATLASGPAQSSPKSETMKKYRVSITNMTDHQIFSPAVAVTHSMDLEVFKVGEPASAGVQMVAEDGPTDTLAAELRASGKAKDVVVADAIMPGETKSFEITADADHPYLSFVSMLATTNDGFHGLHGKNIYRYRNLRTYTHAYDAGTENNSESCQYVPGPPCSAHGVRDPEGGVVMMHENIQGRGNVPVDFDWQPKVSKVWIEKIH